MPKREPVAELGAEGYRIVRHTHDVELAEKLMRAKLELEYEESYEDTDIGRPRLEWMRVTPCLPNSYGAYEGWAFAYTYAEGPGRGVFPAVVFS